MGKRDLISFFRLLMSYFPYLFHVWRLVSFFILFFKYMILSFFLMEASRLECKSHCYVCPLQVSFDIFLIHSLTYSHTNTHTLTLTHSHSHKKNTHSLTHTHTHTPSTTHIFTHTHTRRYTKLRDDNKTSGQNYW